MSEIWIGNVEALGYFVFWAVAVFLMMRFGCGAHVTGHRHGSPPAADRSGLDDIRWIPPEKDRDPVCGKLVKTETAKPSVYGGSVYYFCSRECRERFEAAPELYVTGGAPDGRQEDQGAIAERSHV